MRIVRYRPAIRPMQRQFEGPRWETDVNLGLAVDVAERGEEFIVKASLPGVDVDDVDVTLEDDLLTIKGEIHDDRELEEQNYHLRERAYGSFGRCIRFPVDVDADRVEANYEHGVLTLRIPKAEAVKPRRIQVNAG